MFNVVLFEPEIPPNTGNIIRLCSNTGCQLHLIQPYGFELDDRKLRRAGLDYHEYTSVKEYPDYPAFINTAKPSRIYACTTRGNTYYSDATYEKGDFLLFGPETRGLPQSILDALPESQRLRIPMLPGNRSLNLSNATALIVYEAWRQAGFTGAE
ncbi:MAG: tRNA (uridine(34)/cytosine(34)/5-carboxymethylaminomethyluridine(34)-2'-O)-methyltransferase TrmL [Gammaproteobacteria bacterium]|nr:tRNA (uridine(34)/cytosine(34)/5-carboxymethylaminomethyluridine(34)-2'-O)-methyltransferase TrmL [Gammaproteobacteria bacterium]